MCANTMNTNNITEREENDKVKTMHLVEKHIIKPTHEMWECIDTLCYQTRCLRNKANFIIRQNYFSKKNHKFLDYNELDKLFKSAKHPDLVEIYRTPPRATIAQQCLRQLNSDWTSFFKAIKSYNKDSSKFKGRPKPPKYKKDLETCETVLLRQEFKVNGRTLILPDYLNNFKINFHNTGKLCQVRFIPCSNKVYKIELVFNVEVPKPVEDKDRILAIDLGVDNLAAIVTNVGTCPILLNGKDLKSINQYYNKEISKCKSLLPMYSNGKQQSNSKLIQRLWVNRGNKISSRMHKYSTFVVDFAESNNISTIVIGYNKNWKQEIKGTATTNQNFQQIPFLTFVQQIEYKAKLKGITVVRQTESYSSGTSFLDFEPVLKKYYNKNRRVHRGLFKTNNSLYINADVNASFQIMKKYLQKLDKSYVVEGLEDLISSNLSYALSPNKVTINSRDTINKLY